MTSATAGSDFLQAAVVALIAAKLGLQLWLERLNRRHTLQNSTATEPDKSAVRERSAEYTIAKSRLAGWEMISDAILLVAALFTGILPLAFESFYRTFGRHPWSAAACIMAIFGVLAATGLPWSWHRQFRLEERFGFNTTTQRLWWVDRAKGLLLTALLVYPLLVIVLKLVHWAGSWWWLWAWAAVLAFQLIITLIAPICILPLFNKFTPLSAGTLRDRLMELARRTGFRAASIQVMDGSRRSLHSNAFFIGLGKFRKIVLFDTLINQLNEPQLEAVLAHEIGHYKKRHIPKMMLVSALLTLAGFFLLGQLADATLFFQAFGFPEKDLAVAIVLFSLLSGLVTFWFSPLAHFWSRRYEYEADHYGAAAVGDAEPLIGALQRLEEKNLSNPAPHPLYSGFYYSHPTLREREAALGRPVAVLT